MAVDSAAASAGRRRLRKQPKQQDRPEALLARHLLRTEFALRDGRRPRREESFWEELAKELNRLMDRITGRRRSAGGGPVAAPGGPDHGTPVAVGQGGPDGAPAAGPGRPVPFEEAVRHGREQFQEMIGRLTAAERRVFEDAVLDLVRGDRKYRKAFESSPESMPLVARYAVDAHLREVAPDLAAAESARDRGGNGLRDPARQDPNARRDGAPRSDGTGHGQDAPGRDDALRRRWERPARDREVPAPSATGSPRGSFSAPGSDDMSDGHGFLEAARAGLAERTTGATLAPRESDAFTGQGFLAAEAAAPREPADADLLASPFPSPSLSASDLEAPPSPMPLPAAPLRSPTGEAVTDSRSPSEPYPVSPLQTAALPVPLTPDRHTALSPLPAPVTPLLGAEGRRSVLDAEALFARSPASFDGSSPTRPNSPAAARHHAGGAPKAPGNEIRRR
ncbi:hypothetical protein ACGFS9_01995 [Streptomyces sp. NPDC048566]|uniref:hypothetical protein n=1 Tax=Streptomyces sp. NPDC048566 TaxID=3365569 RepID=UPI00372196D2